MSEKTAAENKAKRAAQEAAPETDRETPDQNASDQQPQQGEPAPSGIETAADIGEASTGEPESADDSLEQALADANTKAEDNWNQYLRAIAELENTRKRAARDVEQTRRFALERFAAELLSVKDSLEMGLDAAADTKDKADALLEGTEMTLKQLTQVFEKFGITEIDPKGERFDPEQHEAMATQPSAEAEPDTVLTVVQKGYLLNGRVLRAARVLVARRPDEE